MAIRNAGFSRLWPATAAARPWYVENQQVDLREILAGLTLKLLPKWSNS